MKNKINIAMRCNQEQWELLKPKLEKSGVRMELQFLKNFNKYPYLTNKYTDMDNVVSAILSENKEYYNRQVHEEFNEKIFLEACGIFKEPKFEITKEQIEYLCNRADCSKSKLKEWFPEVFPAELIIGKWYKGNIGFESLICVQKVEKCISYNKIHYYGFSSGTYREKDYIAHTRHEESLVEATTEEVTEALKNEALKRYKAGDLLKNFEGYYNGRLNNMIFKGKDFCVDSDESFCARSTNNYWIKLMDKNGIWATVIPTKTIKEAEELLNCKIV